jgi:hypothetical protein
MKTKMMMTLTFIATLLMACSHMGMEKDSTMMKEDKMMKEDQMKKEKMMDDKMMDKKMQ